MISTGDLIKNARERAGLSRKELGHAIGVAVPNLCNWENNKYEASLSSLKKIAEALNSKLLLEIVQRKQK